MFVTASFVAEKISPSAATETLQVVERAESSVLVERIDEHTLAARAADDHQAAVFEGREHGRDRVVAHVDAILGAQIPQLVRDVLVDSLCARAAQTHTLTEKQKNVIFKVD